MKLLIFSLCLIITWLAEAWAYVFLQVLVHGQYIAVEPVDWILNSEFLIAAALAVTAFSGAILALVMKLNKERR